MRRLLFFIALTSLSVSSFAWGFFAHRRINYYAIFLLPPEMLFFYKNNAGFLVDHAVDPDKRRYIITEEGPRHFIDLDRYGEYPFQSLPRNWNDAVLKYSEDSLVQHGIVPWWVQTMLNRLTDAFREKNQVKILKLSAEIGHYIADAHVPLHACSNHNGQYTGQKGIHGFWESRVPELLADSEWDFFIGKADYINNPGEYIWNRVMESALAADTVLKYEKQLTMNFPSDQKFAFEERNGMILRQYSSWFSSTYDKKLNGMIERRMRLSVFSVAAFWYTAWVNAGQPDLTNLTNKEFSPEDLQHFSELNNAWKMNNHGLEGHD
jgi:hypothetical protein